MFSPDKNDVDISRLFNWSKNFVIDTNEGAMTVHMRIVGDADLNMARVYALRCSTSLRKKLKNVESDEYNAYIIPKELTSKEELVDLVLLSMNRQFGLETAREVVIPFPKEPDSDAPLEKVEKYQQDIDTYQERVAAEIDRILNLKIEKEKKRIAKKTFDELYSEYVASTVKDIADMEMYTKFKAACACFSCYKDAGFKNRLFETIEQFNNLPLQIKERFLKEYADLEVDIDDLKK